MDAPVYKGQPDSQTVSLQRVVARGNGDAEGTDAQPDNPLETLASFVERHEGDLRRFARSLARTDELAGDLVQHALMKTVETLRRDVEIEHMSAWLRRCVYYGYLNHVRREPPVPLDKVNQEPSEPLGLSELADIRERLRAVDTILGTLPDHYQAAFVLAEVHGLTYDEIAQTMNRTTKSVARILYRARDIIRARSSELA